MLNFSTAFADGKLFSLLINYYYPNLCTVAGDPAAVMRDDDEEDEFQRGSGESRGYRRLMACVASVSALGGVPGMLAAAARGLSQGALDEQSIVAIVGALATRLLAFSRQKHACRAILRWWRHHHSRRAALAAAYAAASLAANASIESVARYSYQPRTYKNHFRPRAREQQPVEKQRGVWVDSPTKGATASDSVSAALCLSPIFKFEESSFSGRRAKERQNAASNCRDRNESSSTTATTATSSSNPQRESGGVAEIESDESDESDGSDLQDALLQAIEDRRVQEQREEEELRAEMERKLEQEREALRQAQKQKLQHGREASRQAQKRKREVQQQPPAAPLVKFSRMQTTPKAKARSKTQH